MYCILIALFIPAICSAWNGILIDCVPAAGNTQIVLPKSHTVIANANLGLPNVQDSEAVQLNGLVYIIGGYNGSSNAIASVMIFNPATNTSTYGPPLLVGRYEHAATVVNNTIIVCGGLTPSTRLTSCEQSNVGVTSWTTFTALPIQLGDHAMLTFNNAPYVFGGYNTSGTVATVYMHNGVNSWMARASMSIARAGLGAIALDMNRALICGGSSSGAVGAVLASCEIYTVSTDSWATAPSMAQARWYFGLVMSEGCKKSYAIL
jgi:hypothetical protein